MRCFGIPARRRSEARVEFGFAAPVQITFDALDPNALCVWWAELLGYEVERDGGDVDLDAAVERQTQRGAVFIEFGAQGGHRSAVMQDPEANEFCLV